MTNEKLIIKWKPDGAGKWKRYLLLFWIYHISWCHQHLFYNCCKLALFCGRLNLLCFVENYLFCFVKKSYLVLFGGLFCFMERLNCFVLYRINLFCFVNIFVFVFLGGRLHCSCIVRCSLLLTLLSPHSG